MPVEDFDGLKLHAQSIGGAGGPLVLVHGLLVGSLSSWFFAMGPALARRHRVLMYDLRGHGLSPGAGDQWGIRAHAADLARVVDRHAGEEPVTLVGHSVGGAIALRYALDHPLRVARLVLIDTPLPVMAQEWVDEVRKAPVAALLKLLPSAQHATVGRGGRQAQRMAAQVLTLVNRTPLLEHLIAEPDFTDDELAGLQPPLLLCYATRSGPVFAATGARLAARVPAARLTLIDGGHFLPIEAASAVTSAICAFHDA
ncbi:MAG: alpha/beta hydrolase [Casimicrobiaceae bacterium]